MRQINTTRKIGLPTTKDGCAPTITASYGGIIGVANMLSTKHYPKCGIGVIYETE